MSITGLWRWPAAAPWPRASATPPDTLPPAARDEAPEPSKRALEGVPAAVAPAPHREAPNFGVRAALAPPGGARPAHPPNFAALPKTCFDEARVSDGRRKAWSFALPALWAKVSHGESLCWLESGLGDHRYLMTQKQRLGGTKILRLAVGADAEVYAVLQVQCGRPGPRQPRTGDFGLTLMSVDSWHQELADNLRYCAGFSVQEVVCIDDDEFALVTFYACDVLDMLEALRQRAYPEVFLISCAIALLGDIAGGLASLHAAGDVHRDVKLENALIDREGVARCTDFGLTLNVRDPRVRRREAVGSFLAPELLLLGEPAEPALDIWGVGANLLVVLSQDAWQLLRLQGPGKVELDELTENLRQYFYWHAGRFGRGGPTSSGAEPAHVAIWEAAHHKLHAFDASFCYFWFNTVLHPDSRRRVSASALAHFVSKHLTHLGAHGDIARAVHRVTESHEQTRKARALSATARALGPTWFVGESASSFSKSSGTCCQSGYA